jgi:hypothetical protein
MFTNPDIRVDIAHDIQRERMARAERHRIAASAVSHADEPPRRPRRLARLVLALAGTRSIG